MWNRKNGDHICDIRGFDPLATCIAWCPWSPTSTTGLIFATGNCNGNVAIWKVAAPLIGAVRVGERDGHDAGADYNTRDYIQNL